MKIPRKLKKKIPKGCYCYKGFAYDDEKRIYRVKPCPFYKHVEGIDGYCNLLKSDIEDQLKNCGINDFYK